MESERMRIGGAVTFCRLAKNSRLSTLEDGLRMLNLGEFIPEPRTPMSCLRAALAETFLPRDKTERVVIRPHKNDITGFAVAVEHPKEHVTKDDAYSVVRAVCGLTKAGEVDLHPHDLHEETCIRDSMRGASGWVPAANVSKSLVTLIDHLQGVSLRPNGGIYWLNADKLDLWSQIATVFEAASPKEDEETKSVPNRIYALKVIADEQTVRAVVDMLADEVDRELQRMKEMVEEPDITPEKCERQIRIAAALSRKVTQYNNSLGPSFGKIASSVETAASHVAMAQLRASAAAVAQ